MSNPEYIYHHPPTLYPLQSGSRTTKPRWRNPGNPIIGYSLCSVYLCVCVCMSVPQDNSNTGCNRYVCRLLTRAAGRRGACGVQKQFLSLSLSLVINFSIVYLFLLQKTKKNYVLKCWLIFDACEADAWCNSILLIFECVLHGNYICCLLLMRCETLQLIFWCLAPPP